MRRQRQPNHAPLYKALSDALGQCLPLPRKVTVQLDLYLWQRLRDELGYQGKHRWRRMAFDACPITLDLWNTRVEVWPKW